LLNLALSPFLSDTIPSLCERITSISLQPTVSRRPGNHLLTFPISDGSQKLYTYTFDATLVSVPYSSPMWSKVLIPIAKEKPQIVAEQFCTPVDILRG
jgi:hypothetical protein